MDWSSIQNKKIFLEKNNKKIILSRKERLLQDVILCSYIDLLKYLEKYQLSVASSSFFTSDSTLDPLKNKSDFPIEFSNLESVLNNQRRLGQLNSETAEKLFLIGWLLLTNLMYQTVSINVTLNMRMSSYLWSNKGYFYVAKLKLSLLDTNKKVVRNKR